MKTFFSRMWHGETNGITAAAVIVGGASLTSRLIGVVRDRVLASTFGAGNVLDAYYAAFRLPDLLYTLIILGALSAGFIPVFAEYLETRGSDAAWRLAERVLSVVGATMIILCSALIVFAPFIVPLTVPGFSPEKMAATIQLTRIMALSPLFLGLSAVMGGVLQATRRFFAFALAPVLYNLGIIFGALVLSPVMGVEGLAWGVVIGAFLHLLTQASVVLRLGLNRIPTPSLRTEGVRRILWLMAPRTAGLAVSQINTVVLLSLASSLPAGSVSVFNLSNNLQAFPIGIFAISFAVAAFPNLARAIGAKNDQEFHEVLNGAAKKIVFLILPSMMIFLLLRAQIVRLVLGAGAFDWNDTILTANLLGVFTLSLVFQALVPLYARAFYALQDTWTPLIAGIVSEVINLALALLFRKMFGILGLAIAFSVASFLNLLLLWGMLVMKRGLRGRRALIASYAKTGIASLALLACGWLARQWLGEALTPLDMFWKVALQSAGAILLGGGAFILACIAFRSKEFEDFRSAAMRRFVKPPQPLIGVEEAQGR